MKNIMFMVAFLALAGGALAAPVVNVDVTGQEKIGVSINVGNAAYTRSLQRNLSLSGLFRIDGAGQVKVSGGPGAVVAEGRGRQLKSSEAYSDDKSARMAARRFADAMVAAYSNGKQKGFACDKIAFVARKGADNTELCVCYPDGGDACQLTTTGKQVVGPRWKNENVLFYTGILNAGPQVWEYDMVTRKRSLKWSPKGLATGATVSPDGRRVALILSIHGNPELYVADIASGDAQRLTNTPLASEGCPAWSPDGRQIVYVSDETRHPQLYIIDVATRAKRRLTSRGTQNVEPDWGQDGRITYITKRGGAQVAVIDPKAGEASALLVTKPGNWSHPSWSRDSRNVVASRDRALFVVDTLVDPGSNEPNPPQQISLAAGNWSNPSWSK